MVPQVAHAQSLWALGAVRMDISRTCGAFPAVLSDYDGDHGQAPSWTPLSASACVRSPTRPTYPLRANCGIAKNVSPLQYEFQAREEPPSIILVQKATNFFFFAAGRRDKRDT